MPLKEIRFRQKRRIEIVLGLAFISVFSACTELQRPEPNPYLAETQPPSAQEFRWSNGRLPKSLDPARASNAPETDIIRTLYEGLTVIDAKSLEAEPGAAQEWTVSEDGLEWTFKLRGDAKWSNGQPVGALDFVRSWQRLYDLGDAAAHGNLLHNFAVSTGKGKRLPETEPEDFQEPAAPADNKLEGDDVRTDHPDEHEPKKSKTPEGNLLAVTAPDDRTVAVKLLRPDKDFPKLVANPIFMPVYGSGSTFDSSKLSARIVSNGAFRITELTAAGITLEPSKTYWNHENVKIEKLQFIPIQHPDEALEAYRTGKIDVLTNTEISPLAARVFSTSVDFRKSTFAALNFYEINFRKPPYNDRRVREALATSIERERLAAGENEGAITPALSFLPFAFGTEKRLVQDKDRARDLLEQAGFPDGRGFPVIKLTVNRNETQLRVARAVIRMWKENLNVQTELVIKESAEIPEIRARSDFDVIRRGVVLPALDEMVCMAAINGTETPITLPETSERRAGTQANANGNTSTSNTAMHPQVMAEFAEPFESEAEALYQLHAIPLYFPTSFALVKPYVTGFDMNSLDAPNLAETGIDTAWQPFAR